ncbi:MAG: hypothetical protein V3R64_09870, partial [Sphingomonadales bacterium]
MLEQAKITLEQIKRNESPQIQSIFGQFDEFSSYSEIAKIGTKISKGIKRLIVLGTGGSSLGAKTLLSILPQKLSGGSIKIQFFDNLSPSETEFALKTISPETTHFLVISNSGFTVEVIAQCILALNYVSKTLEKNSLKDHFTFITGPEDNPLRAIAQELNIPVLDHDPDLTGRFSVFSKIGLLPAFIGGANILAIFQGAQY